MYPSTTALVLAQRADRQDPSPSTALPPPPTLPAPEQPSDSPTIQPDRDCDVESNSSGEIIDLDPNEQGARTNAIVKAPIFSRSEVSLSRKGRTRLMLDSDEDEDTRADLSHSPRTRRNTLSPLKTLFPYLSTRGHERTHSAHPSNNGSPYSSHASFFTSTTSLKMPMSTTSFPSPGRAVCRRLLSFKAHERRSTSSPPTTVSPPEPLETWEVVDSCGNLDHEAEEKEKASPSTVSPNPSSRSQKSVRIVEAARPNATTPGTQTIAASQQSIHPLSLRDRKIPVIPHIRKPTRRATSPPPRLEPVIPQGPIVTTVRTRMAITAPPVMKSPELVNASPQEDSSRHGLGANHSDPEALSPFQRALVIPLPLSPVEERHSERGPVHKAPPINMSSPVPFRSPPLISLGTECDLMTLSIHPTPNRARTNLSSTSLEELDSSPNTRQHYRGRPLPSTPSPAARTAVDSIYASQWDEGIGGGEAYFSEGLLIDLNDTSLTTNQKRAAVPSQTEMGPGAYTLEIPSPVASSRSSVNFSESPTGSLFPPLNATALVSPKTTETRAAISGRFLEVTDLDMLVSRLDERSRNVSDYEDLLLLSDFIGPASPQTVAPRTPMSPSSNVLETKRNPKNENIALLANVEVERQRTTNDGRLKLKLVLIDAPVDRCGICLTQFKDNELARLGSLCRHAFHDKCLKPWLPTSKTCPMCRVRLAAQ